MLVALKLATNLLQSQRQDDRSTAETIDSVRNVRRRLERRLEKASDSKAELPAAS